VRTGEQTLDPIVGQVSKTKFARSLAKTRDRSPDAHRRSSRRLSWFSLAENVRYAYNLYQALQENEKATHAHMLVAKSQDWEITLLDSQTTIRVFLGESDFYLKILSILPFSISAHSSYGLLVMMAGRMCRCVPARI
jgi:hypothetical protein